MHEIKDTIFSHALEVAASLADAHISAEIAEQTKRERVEQAIRELNSMGCPIDEISAATGWTPTDIQRSLERDARLADLAVPSGIA